MDEFLYGDENNQLPRVIKQEESELCEQGMVVGNTSSLQLCEQGMMVHSTASLHQSEEEAGPIVLDEDGNLPALPASEPAHARLSQRRQVLVLVI
jgi:hypothetical protein